MREYAYWGILHLTPSFMNAYELKLNDMYIEYDNIIFFFEKWEIVLERKLLEYCGNFCAIVLTWYNIKLYM